MIYRMIEEADIPAFVEHRMAFVQGIRTLDDPEAFAEATRQYVQRYRQSDRLFIFLAVDGTTIAASCMLSIYQTPPVPSNPTGTTGELLNVFTLPPYRRQGHAAALLRLLMAEAQKRGVRKIVLDYTEAGYPLYRALGFTPREHQMEYRF